MVSVAEGLRMMQGGVDRTGYADMADQLGNPGMDLILQRRAAAEEEAGVQEILDMMAAQIPGGEEPGGQQPGGEETGGFNFGGVFDDYIPESILSMPAEDMSKMDELATMGVEAKFDGMRGLKNISTPKVPSTGVPKTGGVSLGVGKGPLNVFKRSPAALAISMVPTVAEAMGVDLPESEAVMEQANRPLFSFEGAENPIFDFDPTFGATDKIRDLFGMADGGRVEMQLGGGIMNALLGSPTPAQAYTPFVSTMPLYDPSTLGTGLPSTAGMADPYFVYDPYSPVGAFDTPKAKTTGFLSREQIDKGFSDIDKFDLRKQKAKAEAAKKAKKQTRRGGGSQEDRARNKARRDAMTERAREQRNRQRGGSGKGTSDPGGQEARGA